MTWIDPESSSFSLALPLDRHTACCFTSIQPVSFRCSTEFPCQQLGRSNYQLSNTPNSTGCTVPKIRNHSHSNRAWPWISVPPPQKTKRREEIQTGCLLVSRENQKCNPRKHLVLDLNLPYCEERRKTHSWSTLSCLSRKKES